MRDLDDHPISADEASAAFSAVGLEAGARVSLAVSGGADSLALLVLAVDCLDVHALTFDHGLRSESAAEAALVASIAVQLGVPHDILTWADKPATGNLQAAARSARYDAMTTASLLMGRPSLLLGHHRGDQAETVLMRLARGSGVKGLAAMRPVGVHPGGCRIVRPFLGFPKSRLIATLRSRGIDWAEDPSNENQDFERVRVRSLLSDRALGDAFEARVADAASALARADAAIDHFCGQARTACVVPMTPLNWYILERERLFNEDWPEEVQLRVIADLVQTLGEGAYAPRLDATERVCDNLREGATDMTLGGCRFFRLTTRSVGAVREAGAILDRVLECGEHVLDLWLERPLSLTVTEPGRTIGVLGAEGWQTVAQSLDKAHVARTWPLPVREALPTLRDGEGGLSVPVLGISPNLKGLSALTMS